jgi:hypothetical protein
VEAAGIEPLASSSGNTIVSPQGGAQSGALAARPETGSQIDAGLVTVVQAWPRLPNAIRAGILAMIRASS